MIKHIKIEQKQIKKLEKWIVHRSMNPLEHNSKQRESFLSIPIVLTWWVILFKAHTHYLTFKKVSKVKASSSNFHKILSNTNMKFKILGNKNLKWKNYSILMKLKNFMEHHQFISRKYWVNMRILESKQKWGKIEMWFLFKIIVFFKMKRCLLSLILSCIIMLIMHNNWKNTWVSNAKKWCMVKARSKYGAKAKTKCKWPKENLR